MMHDVWKIFLNVRKYWKQCDTFCDYAQRSVRDVRHHHLAPEVRESEQVCT